MKNNLSLIMDFDKKFEFKSLNKVDKKINSKVLCSTVDSAHREIANL